MRDAFRTPDIPMLGVALFSPHTQVRTQAMQWAGREAGRVPG
jgi:hypothetical protein